MEHKRKKQSESVADQMFIIGDEVQDTELSQGLAETHEQINDTFSSGHNDVTFLRDGKDLVKERHDSSRQYVVSKERE